MSAACDNIKFIVFNTLCHTLSVRTLFVHNYLKLYFGNDHKNINNHQHIRLNA